MNHRHQLSTTAAADGLQLGSGLRRIVCLAALLFIFVIGARAVEYKIKVGGVPVTSSNASNVTGDNIKAYSSSVNGGKPSVVYNSSTNTLTLWNVKIERKGSGNRAILNDGVAGLKVVLRGQNYLKAENSSPVRFNANTTLTSTYNGTKERSWIIGDEEDALTVGSGATLTILDADLWLEAANSSAFDASGSPSLIIRNSSVQALSKADALSSDSHALQDYYSLSVYNSEVILRQYSIYGAAVKNLASFTLGTDMVCYVWPWTRGDLYSEEGHFDSSKKTFWGNKSNNSVWEVNLKRDGVVINSTNFPNQNFRNYVSSTSIDKNGDGFLGKSEIAKVTSLNVNGRSITSLTGIGYFTELTSLDCSTNSLTSLNLSNNTKLTKLFCSNNRLTALDVSKNTALTTLDCSNNRLTALDVSKNTALTTLDCSNNQLTTLDVSKNTALTYLYCSNNQLTSLDLSKNTKLTTLEVYKNKIRSLDASSLIRNLPQVSNGQLKFFYNENATTGNLMTTVQVEDAKKKGWTPKESTNGSTWTDYNGAIFISSTTFPDANFRNFLLAQSYGKDGYLTEEEIAKIKQLDVSGRSISDLTGIEYFTELTYLNCSNNSLTSLDLSNNTTLLTLHCFNNQLTALNIKYNIEYMDVYCYGNKLNDPSNVTYLLNHLPSHGGTLYFYKDETPTGNWLLPVSVTIFKRNNWAVKKANNNGGWEDYEGEDAIALQWIRDENFRNWIAEQSYGQDGWIIPAEIAAVTVIEVPDMKIKSLKGIEYFTALEELNCNNNELTELDISKNTALTRLDCGFNHLTELDVSNNTALKILRCGSFNSGYNQISELDVSNNPALTRLDCYNCSLTSIDVSHNPALIYLGLGANRLTELDASNHPALEALSCINNQLSKLNVSGCTALFAIECYGNKLRGEEMTAFVNSLETMAPVSYSNKGLYVYGYKDENIITPSQVKIAKDKEWRVLDYSGKDYEGIIIDGDANGDGEVTEADLETVRDIVLGISPSGYEEGADLNHDGTVDIQDLTKLIQLLTE